MLGGVGFISKREYFSGASIFYILALGVGMLLIYTVFNTHINVHKDYSLMDKLSLIMVIIGCFGTFMVASYYLTHINEVIDTKTILYFQWRNNCSTFLMLSIPFAFYRGNKKSYSIMFGFLFYFAYRFARRTCFRCHRAYDVLYSVLPLRQREAFCVYCHSRLHLLCAYDILTRVSLVLRLYL